MIPLLAAALVELHGQVWTEPDVVISAIHVQFLPE